MTGCCGSARALTVLASTPTTALRGVIVVVVMVHSEVLQIVEAGVRVAVASEVGQHDVWFGSCQRFQCGVPVCGE